MNQKPLAGDRLLRAVALSYDERDAAGGLPPKVVAAGQAAIADAIIARARELGIPVHESRELVAALMHFDLDQRIPPALYVAVAEVLTWAYRLEHGAQGVPGQAMERIQHAGAMAAIDRGS
jgi:flagellar biosynthesis protein